MRRWGNAPPTGTQHQSRGKVSRSAPRRRCPETRAEHAAGDCRRGPMIGGELLTGAEP